MKVCIYCKAPFDLSSLIKLSCSPTSTNVLAAIVPDAATPGKPMPGKVVSPHARRPFTGVFGPGSSHCNCKNNKFIPMKLVLESDHDIKDIQTSVQSLTTSFPIGGAGPYVPRNR